MNFKNTLRVCSTLLLLVVGRGALAQENIDGFHNIANEVQPPSPSAPEPFGRVPTKKISLVNLAPVLLPYFNNGPVFGIPGTETGNFWRRTQLTGDWGGLRTDLARHGFFFDIYSTTAGQDVTSGGLETGWSFAQNIQYSINIDTARAGLWSGGIIHFTAQSRYGDSPAQTFTAGTVVPQYTALVHPGPLLNNSTYPTEYYIAQALSRHFSLVVGKISDVFIPDQTLFGDSYKYHFANFNFLKNPMTVNFYNPTALSALGVWAANKHFALAGGVLDPNSEADNFNDHAFDRVNIYGMAIVSYKIGNLPGQFSPAYNWSNKPKTDLSDPFGAIAPSQVPQAVGFLLGVAPATGLPVNYQKTSWFAIANASQYLFVKDSVEAIGRKMRSGQLLSGIGILGRVGYAPEETNTITNDGSITVFAHGLWERRPYDSFGAGFYYDAISGDLKNSFSALTEGLVTAKNEKGVELFYDFALTPAVRIIPSYQHVWNPLTTQVATGRDHADVFLIRLNLAW